MGEHYRFTNGWTMEREPFVPGFWLLSDENGAQVDRDQYRHDLIERHRLTVELHKDPSTTLAEA